MFVLIYSGKSGCWCKLSGAYQVVKMSAQKAAQGAPRAETVAVHRAIMRMGLHLGPSWGPLGVVLEASGGLFWGLFGASFGPLV